MRRGELSNHCTDACGCSAKCDEIAKLTWAASEDVAIFGDKASDGSDDIVERSPDAGISKRSSIVQEYASDRTIDT
jgi:hypothetical protein